MGARKGAGRVMLTARHCVSVPQTRTAPGGEATLVSVCLWWRPLIATANPNLSRDDRPFICRGHPKHTPLLSSHPTSELNSYCSFMEITENSIYYQPKASSFPLPWGRLNKDPWVGCKEAKRLFDSEIMGLGGQISKQRFPFSKRGYNSTKWIIILRGKTGGWKISHLSCESAVCAQLFPWNNNIGCRACSPLQVD